jgi:dinuclear metal center YbgI/SA1388 family protein
MTSLDDVCAFLERFAPARLAEEWDNVGLLVGDRQRTVRRLMTCLTITPASAKEAIEQEADLIVTHHPLPFRPLKRITTDTVTGRLLLELISANVAIHSPHTAFDSAAAGINQQLAEGLALQNVAPLQPRPGDVDALGSGRFGSLAAPLPLSEVAGRVRTFLKINGLHQVGADDQRIHSVALACGSAGDFLDAARRAGCQLLVTGETSFHTCLEAEANGMALLLPGHYASERFGVENLATLLAKTFDSVLVWASQRESDPLSWRA